MFRTPDRSNSCEGGLKVVFVEQLEYSDRVYTSIHWYGSFYLSFFPFPPFGNRRESAMQSLKSSFESYSPAATARPDRVDTAWTDTIVFGSPQWLPTVGRMGLLLGVALL